MDPKLFRIWKLLTFILVLSLILYHFFIWHLLNFPLDYLGVCQSTMKTANAATQTAATERITALESNVNALAESIRQVESKISAFDEQLQSHAKESGVNERLNNLDTLLQTRLGVVETKLNKCITELNPVLESYPELRNKQVVYFALRSVCSYSIFFFFCY